ncbi:hypothetical protein CN918_27945 [Priestia megaterium]|nr:hypothetical protein CN918_27945 [Priestia megaterium]
MSQTLLVLIIVAFLLNIGGFFLYALALRKKKLHPTAAPPAMPTKNSMVQDQIRKSENVAKNNKQKEASGLDYEDWKKQKEKLENEKNQKENEVDVDKISKALDELQYGKKTKISKGSANETLVSSANTYNTGDNNYSGKEKEYEIDYEEAIQDENNEVIQAFEEPHKPTRDIEENKKGEQEDDEPFELLADMGARTLEEENSTQTNTQVSHDTHDTHEKKASSQSKNDNQEEAKTEAKREVKRELIDSVNILEVEGEDEPEDLYDEIVVRHYEPYAYKPSSEEEEEIVDEEVDEEAELEKRIAFLAGEWTEDYIVQPKQKPNKKK